MRPGYLYLQYERSTSTPGTKNFLEQCHKGCRPKIMFLKVLVFLVLVGACGVFADNHGLSGFEVNQTALAKKGGIRDSKCSDRYYSDCFPRRPFLELNLDFEVCQSICQNYQEPTCDWFTFDTQEFNKCQMFSNELGTMGDFFASCGQVGGPTRQ